MSIAIYSVQAGDSLTKIAKQLNVRAEDILRVNPLITDPNLLKLGQRISIPAAASEFRPLSDIQGPIGDILGILRQGSAMFTSKLYSAYNYTLSVACSIFSCSAFDRKRFYDAYRAEFGRHALKQQHVDGLNLLLGFIEHDPDVTNLKVMAYMLATIHHETYWPETNERYKPIIEKGDKSYFNKYDPVLANSPVLKKRAIKEGNTVEGDGYKYRGRGYVQLTWKNNYKKCGDIFGYDLVTNPDLVLKPNLSYKIISYGMRTGLFTGLKIGDFISGANADYEEARRVINGTDKASDIAGYAIKFERIIAQSIMR